MKLIGIAGGSGTGKTTIANELFTRLKKETIIISLDSYYKDNSHLTPGERIKLNFDHPLAFDYDLFYEHLSLLKNGESINKPTYSYIERTRQEKTESLSPTEILLIEGILLYLDERIVNLLDYKLFIDLDEKNRLANIIKRDVKERGRNKEEVVSRFYEEVNPMHNKFVEGQKHSADFIIENIAELNSTCDMIINHLKFKNLC